MSRLAAVRSPSAHLLETGSARSAVAAVLSTIMVAASLLLAPAASGATGDVGYEDQSITGTSDPTGTKRAESVLWWNDGAWWGDMWDVGSGDFHIFRLDLGTQTWIDTGIATDTRSNTHADVLWDGSHLYVASHLFVADEDPAVPGSPSYLYRFSYDAGSKTYSKDSGFPVLINNYKTETLVIDKDSTGKLWATWQQDNLIYVNRTVGGDDHTWGTPFQLPTTGTSVTVDDGSAVVAFGGDSIGLMWSNQSSSNDAMYFAVHRDGDPDGTWQAARTAIQGPNTSDDHINLKSLQADGSGRVYAAVKTSFTSSAQPLIMLLVRDTSTGDWANYPIARVSECPNRPMVLIDEENRVLHAFFSAPGPTAYACNSSGGEINEKTSPLDGISFPIGAGTPVIVDADSPYVHNVSSTKQNVSSLTGIVILARNSHAGHYWHAYQAISPGSNPPPAPVAAFTGTPTSGTAPLAVNFTDQSTNSPTSWAWSFGDNGTSTAQSPSHTYTTAGTYTVTLTATNNGGSDGETKTAYITVTPPPAPVAAFTGTPTSGTAPLAVNFTDQSANSPTSWAWSFGDNGTSTAQSPSHTYTTAGTYTVTLTATNNGGSDGETKTAYITVTPPPAPVAAFTGTPTSGTAPLAVNFTDQSTNSPTSWAWSFGDNGTSTAQSPSHTYTTAGTYTVTLTATNNGGSDGETKTAYITVTPPPAPVAAFTGTPTSGTAPLAVNFTDQSTNSPTSWAWSFGDNGTSTAQSPSHTYTTAGTYTVTLTATNNGGSDGETKTAYITVTPPPPNFALAVTPSKQTVVKGQSTSYTITVTPINGFAGAVNLAASGFPAGASGTFGQNPLNAGAYSTTLAVSTTTAAKPGSSTIVVTATSGGLSHSSSTTLQIKQK